MDENELLPLVVIIDDEMEILMAIKRCIMRLKIRVESFTSPRLALEFIKDNQPLVVISDQRMPDIDGHKVLNQVKELWPSSRRVMLSAYRDFELVAEGFNQSVIERFVAKPWKNKELIFIIEESLALSNEAATNTKTKLFTNIIGESSAMQALYNDINAAAGANVPIFIHGETGTGKELVAKACHHHSYRKEQNFVAVNCANFSETLIESQLFGHKKGAFTGAVNDQIGLLKQCQGGTLFLDEVTTLPLTLQAKLLRVLQEREFTPVGDTKIQSFDTQIVSASSMRLVDAVKQGEFRQDLYYRLNVIPLKIPALRERGNDIILIACSYLELYSKEQGKSFKEFEPEAERLLLDYAWPGNVRQLENLIHSVVIMNVGTSVTAVMLTRLLDDELLFKAEFGDEIKADLRETPMQSMSSQAEVIPLADIEKQAILAAIDQCDGNISQAAALLEVNPSTIYRKMQRW